MLADHDIERKCRYRLERNGLRMHKVDGNNGPVYYLYKIGEEDTIPDETENYRWLSLAELLNYCEELEENNVS